MEPYPTALNRRLCPRQFDYSHVFPTIRTPPRTYMQEFESPILRSETPREIWGSFALSDQGQSWCSEKLPNNVRSASLERPNREVVGAFIAISAPACATQALENDLQAKAGMHKQTRMGLSKLVNVHHRKIEHSVECTHVRRSDWTMSSTALRGPRSGSRRSENRRSQAQALPSRSCLA